MRLMASGKHQFEPDPSFDVRGIDQGLGQQPDPTGLGLLIVTLDSDGVQERDISPRLFDIISDL